MDKIMLRKERLALIKKLSNIERERKTEAIHKKIKHTWDWEIAKVIGVTISINHEIDTYRLIESAWRANKKIVIPKTSPKQKLMDFYLLTSFDQLEDASFGLKEPKENVCKKVRKEEIDLLIVPGVVFDHKGFRVGYGGGFYDRFLTDFNGRTAALAYECQVVERVPREGHDIAVNQVITETRVIVNDG